MKTVKIKITAVIEVTPDVEDLSESRIAEVAKEAINVDFYKSGIAQDWDFQEVEVKKTVTR